MADDVPLTLHDHMLAHALTALVSLRMEDPRREALWLSLLQDALPGASRGVAQVAALCGAAQKLLDNPDGGGRVMAHWAASTALVAWSEWRIGLVQDRLRVTA